MPAGLTLHILAAVAEHERELIAERYESCFAGSQGARESV